ncbi:hypothetical protein [Halalkalicoccus tibetensis]|uniref:Uncharacterized protein n=1 Tax=Halalkalicoccus tibetensis TaxID=175632 RepID=A0ABD5V6E9_9EURY
MSAEENIADCYTHSREFTHEGHAFRVRINDDLMSYTATVSRDGEVVTAVTDLGPEAAEWSHSTLADLVLE